MKQQITENEENLFFGKKCPGVSSDLKSKKEGKDPESRQSSITPDPGQGMGK